MNRPVTIAQRIKWAKAENRRLVKEKRVYDRLLAIHAQNARLQEKLEETRTSLVRQGIIST